MKRWRRPLILIALLLLGGAVVNVVVAWVLVGAPGRASSYFTFPPEVVPDPVEPDREKAIKRLAGRFAPPGGRARNFGRVVRGLGWEWISTGHDCTTWVEGCWLADRVAGGWPLRSMAVDRRMVAPAREWELSPSLEPPHSLLPSRRWFPGYHGRDRVPLTPLAAGFAINTLFYTAILALPLSFFPIRRRLRARRGRCPKCGYDLAGLGGADPGGERGAPCPECGAAR